jgi:hypothetical protein
MEARRWWDDTVRVFKENIVNQKTYVMQNYLSNSSAWEAEAGRFWVWSQPGQKSLVQGQSGIFKEMLSQKKKVSFKS